MSRSQCEGGGVIGRGIGELAGGQDVGVGVAGGETRIVWIPEVKS